MISVLVSSESRYPTNRKLVREVVGRTLKAHELKENVEVSVAVVGDRKMRALSKKYRGLDKTTDVLSFTFEESSHAKGPGPDGVLRLGEVVISFPQVRMWAIKRNKMLDDILAELVEHGTLHLLGRHHPE
jgi:probable rRNA maturation factor